MATLATQTIDRAGLAPSYAPATSGGDQFTPGLRTFLHAKNAAASATTVTVITPGEAAPDLAIADLAVSVPAGGEAMIGPLPGRLFADPANTRLATVNYSSATSVTVAALDLAAE